jgi:ABC transporter substrate binding protein
MRRRDFIIEAVRSAAALWPLAAGAQQAKPTPRIGYLSFAFGGLGVDAFREGLRGFGYVEGKDVLVEDRRAGKPSHLDDLAAELVVSKVDIIVCGGSQATRAALAQTRTIPIVTLSSDPVAVGFVASLSRPGGNVTGVSLLAPELAGQAGGAAEGVDSIDHQGCGAVEPGRPDCALVAGGDEGSRSKIDAHPADPGDA